MPATAARPRAPASVLPGGTVTFLFTDIEGSTRLWETQRAAMNGALARHDELLRQCIAAHNGHVFKATGDGFCAVFASAVDAVNAALAAQRALHTERWPAEAAIRARMALHAGVPEIRDGDYFGTPLNQVARLLAAGSGGQALLSDIAQALCRDRLPAGATLKALGEHGFRDVPRRETVYQLCHADLPQAFPPLRTQSATTDADTPSIAVLPFVNMSRDEENEYFADGLAEELLTVLSKIGGLRVASRTSAFSFKGSKADIPAIAQKLNVANVLEGSVRKAGTRVRITAQLIHAASESHLWSEAYDRELDDIFIVQDDIAQAVVTELRRTLLGAQPEEARAKAAARTDVQNAARGRGDHPEAYRLYLQGRYFVKTVLVGTLDKAIDCFRQALDLDPSYALAMAWLSHAYAVRAGHFAPHADVERARTYALRALEMAPDLADAHTALGLVQMLHDFDLPDADASFRRALTLAPADAEILTCCAALAVTFGNMAEAIAISHRVLAIDPMNAATYRRLGLIHAFAGQDAEAEDLYRKALAFDPMGGKIFSYLARLQVHQGRLDEALVLAEREPISTFRLLALADVHRARGDPDGADAALRELTALDPDGSAFQIAEIHALRGDADRAFEWLEHAYTHRDTGLISMKLAIPLRSLHGDPRWPALLRKMGLAEAQDL